jgi:hypothetical protein
MLKKLNQVATKISSFYGGSSSNIHQQQQKKPRRRYLATIYNGLAAVRSAYERYELKKTSYDPFQVEQISEVYQYNPFHQEASSNSTSDMSDEENNTVVDEDMILVEEDTKEDVVMINDEKVQEPVAKRIRTMAQSAAENAVHTFVYGAMVTFDFVWNEKKSLKDFVQEKSNDIAKQITPSPPQPKMRGFGVDFSPVVERPPALQIRMDRAERNIRDICKRAELSVQENAKLSRGYNCLPLKRSHDDDTWGMVECDYSVQFKVTFFLLVINHMHNNNFFFFSFKML